MRRALAALALALLAACGGPGASERLDRPPLPPAPPPPPVVEKANFELVVAEVVPTAEDEGVSQTALFVEGAPAGRTEAGPRSAERRLRLRLPPGNHLIRLEHWELPPVGEWTRLPDSRQPRERFVRVEDGALSRLTLRYDAEGRPALSFERAPAEPAP
jgi:hypothetical protein